MKLVNRLVRQFAKAFHTFLVVTFHVVCPNCDVLGIHQNCVLDLCCSLSTSNISLIKNDAGFPNRLSFAIVPTSWACFYFLLPSSFREQTLTTITAFCSEDVGTPVHDLFPSFFNQNCLNFSLPQEPSHWTTVKIAPQWSQCCGLLALGNVMQSFGTIVLPKDEQVLVRLSF